MHTSAAFLATRFFQTYVKPEHKSILDVGSYNVNGTLRDYAPAHMNYLGIDREQGPGVDIVLEDAYQYPFNDNTFDFVVSSSCFEHDDFFWLTFLECSRVVNPGGFIYINAPSNGQYHCYPRDSWRFYPDSGIALESWARRNKHHLQLLESFIYKPMVEEWMDCVMVFCKGPPTVDRLISSQLDGFQHLRTFPTNHN